MNILVDALPHDVEIDGVRHAIDPGFRAMVRFELMMQDNTLSDESKIIRGLCAFYVDRVPDNVGKAVERLIWFYRCGGQEAGSTKQTGRAAMRAYSFEHDADMIYAAFFDQYGIDLQQADLHWWQFKAMFRALRNDNEFVKIMGYRSMDIPDGMSREQKEFYRKMKELHKLPHSRAEQERLRELERILMGDGKL